MTLRGILEDTGGQEVFGCHVCPAGAKGEERDYKKKKKGDVKESRVRGARD